MNFNELKMAISNNLKMIWNDPDPIKNNNYQISHIEDLEDFEELTNEEFEDVPILIQYNNGFSESEVLVNELILIN